MVRFVEGRVLSFHLASGTSLADYTAIVSAAHEERGYNPRDLYSWLVEWFANDDGSAREGLGPKEWACYEDVWRAPDGTSFVTPRQGGVVRLRDGQRVRHELPFVVTAVSGVDSGEVYVAGISGGAEVDRADHLVRWDGKRFADIETPGYVLRVRGPNPGLLYAVGRRGLLAHWDGNAWRKFLPEGVGDFSGLTVIDDDTAYASGWSGELYELSPHGCSLVARHQFPLIDVGHCAGQIYAAGLTGLSRLQGTALVPVELEGAPRRLESRGGNLLITTADRIIEMRDEQTMTSRLLFDVAGPILDAEPEE